MSLFYAPGSQGVPDGRKPEIEYPCPWSYTLIGRSRRALSAAVAELLGQREHRLADSHTSPGGKYRSMKLELVVADEPDRLRIFAALSAHDAVRFVL